MFKRLRKWIHRNNPDWLEKHGYVEKELVIQEVARLPRQETKEVFVERSVIQANTCSVARCLGLGYKH